MTRNRIAALVAAFTVLVMAPICTLMFAGEMQQHVDNAVAIVVSDKPYVEMAAEAATVAEECDEQQEETYLYEQGYWVETYNSYWYTSDDEEAEAAAKEWIAWRESGGDYNSRNGQYVGRYQLNEMYLDGDYSEENQEAAAEAYIADRYGSWQAAQEHWREYGWY